MPVTPTEPVPSAPNTTASRLADLHERRAASAAHDAAAAEKQGARGKHSARERVEMLLDEGSFTELDALVTHRSTAFGLDRRARLQRPTAADISGPPGGAGGDHAR